MQEKKNKDIWEELENLKCINGTMYFGSVEKPCSGRETGECCINEQTFEEALDELKQYITDNFISKEEALQVIREAYYDGLNNGQSGEDYIDDNFSAEEYLTRHKI